MIIKSTASFTRPADTTAYANGDLIANSVTAGSVTPMAFSTPPSGFKLWRAAVKFNSAVPTNAKFLLHLYSSAPTVTNGDNGAWLSIEAGYLGNIAVDASALTFSDSTSAYSAQLTAPMVLSGSLSSSLIYGLLTATAAYTPTSGEIFTVTLIGED